MDWSRLATTTMKAEIRQVGGLLLFEVEIEYHQLLFLTESLDKWTILHTCLKNKPAVNAELSQIEHDFFTGITTRRRLEKYYLSL